LKRKNSPYLPAKIAKSNHMIVSDRPPFSSLLRIFVLVLFVGWLVIGQTIGLAIGALLYEGSFINDYGDLVNHPELKNALLLTLGVGSAIGLILLPIYYLKFLERKNIGTFFKNESNWMIMLVALFLAVIGLSMSISPIVEWNANVHFPTWMSGFETWARNYELQGAETTKLLTSNLSLAEFLFTFIVVAIIPGIGEELVFRGLIQTEFQRALRNPHAAIWITAMLFSAIHVQFFGFLPRMFIGAFLGYLFYWSGNLLVSMIAHFFNNGIQLLGLYLYQKGIITIDLESTESAPWTIVAIGTVATFLLLAYLRNYFISRSTSISDIH